MKRTTLSICAVAICASLAATTPARATGGGVPVEPGGVCGLWAFGGAFSSLSSARRQARRLWSNVYDLRDSNSPNNHRRLFVVATGPASTRGFARQWVREMKHKGVRNAYMARRCFYGGAL